MEWRHTYYSRYLIDLCVPWLDESSPLYERSAEGFCLLINAWNKKSSTFIEPQSFCFLSNFTTKGHWSSHNETAASAWRQQNAEWWSEIKNKSWHQSNSTHCNHKWLNDGHGWWRRWMIDKHWFTSYSYCSTWRTWQTTNCLQCIEK